MRSALKTSMLERIRRKTSNALMLYCTIGILIPSCLDGSMDGWMDGWMDVLSKSSNYYHKKYTEGKH